jgi:hypothetical protein
MNEPVSAVDYYVFGFVSLFNTITPIIYYVVSTDYGGKYYEKNPDQFPKKTLKASLLQAMGPVNLTEMDDSEEEVEEEDDVMQIIDRT